MKHELKILPDYFERVKDGSKAFELRFDDRGYANGDELVLKEWSPRSEAFTGRKLHRKVTYILRDFEGLTPGWVILGLHWHMGGGVR